jgi:hypothetical protein
MSFNRDIDSWTFGAEHELADWDRSKPLPEGITLDVNERTMGNSCGSAVDGKGIYTKHGGEFLTAPSTLWGQVIQFESIIQAFPEARPNNRSGLHIHIHVPGLSTDLDALKAVQRYVHSCPGWVQALDPIPAPRAEGLSRWREFEGAQRRYRRLKASHHSMVTEGRVKAQMAATTVDEFFEAEVRAANGKLIWNLIRSCVNLRHLRQTDTIEFRHFFATLDPVEVHLCLQWCRSFLMNALGSTKESLEDLLQRNLEVWHAPACMPYIHWQDERFWATTLDGSIPRETAIENLRAIEAGEFKSGPRFRGANLREWTDQELKEWR